MVAVAMLPNTDPSRRRWPLGIFEGSPNAHDPCRAVAAAAAAAFGQHCSVVGPLR